MTCTGARLSAWRHAGAIAAVWVASGCAQKMPVQSFADVPDRIRPGHAVYVIDTQGEETRGRLQEVSPSGLTVSGTDGLRSFSADSVTAIDRYGDPLWNGLAIGLGIGTAMALFADQREIPCPDGRPRVCRDAEIGSRLGAIALFGAIGTGVDALIRRRTPVYLAPGQRPSSRLVISPAVSPRGAAAILTLSTP
jgi:hypothetical protein